MSTTTKALLALTATMLIWAVVPVFTRTLVLAIDPGEMLVIRYTISALLFAVLLPAVGGWRLHKSDLPRFLAAAATGGFGYNVANVYGYATTSASLAVMIIGTEPAMIAVLAAMMLGEPLRWPVIAGCVLAFAGTVLLVGGEELGSWLGFMTTPAVDHVRPATDLKGPLLILLAAFAWSLFVVIVKPLLVKYGTTKTSTLNGLFTAPLILALARPSTLQVAAALTPAQWGGILFLAVLGTVVSIYLWNYGVRHVSAASAGAFIYSLPVLSVALAVPLLDETLTPMMIAGGVLILIGVGVAQLRR